MGFRVDTDMTKECEVREESSKENQKTIVVLASL
jgi:hypothetical protein